MEKTWHINAIVTNHDDLNNGTSPGIMWPQSPSGIAGHLVFKAKCRYPIVAA